MSRRPVVRCCRSTRVGALAVLVLLAGCAGGLPPLGLRSANRVSGHLAPPEHPDTRERRAPFVTLAPSAHFAPVRVSEAEFREGMGPLLRELPLQALHRPAGPGAATPGQPAPSDVEAGYARYCALRRTPGDCLALLEGSTHLRETGRLSLALALALGPSLEGTTGVLGSASVQALPLVSRALSEYLARVLAREPLPGGPDATMTLVLWSYLGSELEGFVEASHGLVEETRRARSFHELEQAGTRFARALKPDTVRLLLLLGTKRLGLRVNQPLTGNGLPGFTQAAWRAESEGGFRLERASTEARAVSVARGRLVLVLPNHSPARVAEYR